MFCWASTLRLKLFELFIITVNATDAESSKHNSYCSTTDLEYLEKIKIQQSVLYNLVHN